MNKKEQAKINASNAVRSGGLAVHDIDAGHWLHAEKPKELLELMSTHSFDEFLT